MSYAEEDMAYAEEDISTVPRRRVPGETALLELLELWILRLLALLRLLAALPPLAWLSVAPAFLPLAQIPKSH